MSRPTLAFGLLLACLLSAPKARAESRPEDRAAADALYDEAGALMKADRFAEACPKLEASERLDPGIGTKFRLAYCYERIGRTASAWAAFNDTESAARKAGDKRADEAAKHAKQIEPLLSRMVLDVAPENRAGGVEIKRDGRVVDPATWTSAIPVDPGAHTIEASGAGRQAYKATITVEAKAGTVTVPVPALAVAPEAGTSGTPRAFWSTQRIAGASVGGAGVVGLVVGAVFGGVTLSKTSESKAHCSFGAATRCDPMGLALRNDAKTTAHVADAALVIGGAAEIAGVVVFFTAPAGDGKASSAVRMVVGPAMAAGGARFNVYGQW